MGCASIYTALLSPCGTHARPLTLYRPLLHSWPRRAADRVKRGHEAARPSTAVVVKVGDGNDHAFNFRGSSFTSAALLEALRGSALFGMKLRRVPLDDCSVWIVRSLSKSSPSAADEGSALELRGAATLETLDSDHHYDAAAAASKATTLFVRVRMPLRRDSAPAAGSPTVSTGAASAASSPSAVGGSKVQSRALFPPGKLSPETLSFMEALPRATATEIEHGCQLLTLPLHGTTGAPIYWPGLASRHLFVRPLFKTFFERADLLASFSRDLPTWRCKTLIRGIPGIGKSSFGL